jgi:hypothetical protein
LGAVAIFSVSLVLFISRELLRSYRNGQPRLWTSSVYLCWLLFVGLACLPLEWSPLFLHANLTVAFVLGVAFNAPLALWPNTDWGLSASFLDFSRGTISLSSMAFFISLAVAMLYLCSILIGRRHWVGSPTGTNKIFHYGSRAIASVVIAYSLTVFLSK